MGKGNVFYSETRAFLGQDMPNLSTILQCKCIFLPKKFVILNKTPIFAVCYYKTQCNISITIKLSQ